MSKSLIFFICLFILSCSSTESTDHKPSSFNLAEARFTKMDGTEFKLASVQQPVLLNLWATWCGPCIREMPALGKVSDDLAGQVTVILASDEDFTRIKEFSQKKLTGITVVKANFAVQELNVTGLPTTLLIDASGKELQRIVGEKPWTATEVLKLFKEAKAQ